MDSRYVWLGVSSVGIAAATIMGVYLTQSANCLWALIFIPILWGR